jgi:hypothetical protein
MVSVNFSGQTVKSMRVSGTKTSVRAREHVVLPTVRSMREDGGMI